MSRNDSEATCEVVKIVEIKKHPNADRLEIAKFAFAGGVIPDYQVVTGKGDFVVGDLAVYISDDMMVPVGFDTEYSKFAFLKDKAKNGYYRVKACRFRGEMSTGLLVDIYSESKINGKYIPGSYPIGRLGEDVSTKLGVVKYENPLDRDSDLSNFPNYSNKRGSWLTRLVQRLGKLFYHPPQIPEYSVLSLRKVPDLFQEGEDVLITEKIHGSNIRFGRVGKKIYIGSHRVAKSDIRPWYLRLFNRKNSKPGYYGTDVWSKWFNNHFRDAESLRLLPRNVIFYGELYGQGIQPWTYGLSGTKVAVFDAYHLKEKRWLGWQELFQLAADIGVNMVPIIRWMHPYNKDELKTAAEASSVLYDGPREGVVIRSADWSKRGKLVSDNYLASKH